MRLPGIRRGRAVSHWHEGVRNYAYKLRRSLRSNGPFEGKRWPVVGTWCPICGFEPNDYARQLRLEALERIAEAKRKRSPTTRTPCKPAKPAYFR